MESESSSAGDAGESAPTTGKVYTVFGPRGGCGKTTIAVNLAVALARMHPGQVCLVDLSLTFGHCAMLLNVTPKRSLAATSADSLAKLEANDLDYYLADHESSLKLFVGSNSPEEGDAVTGAHVNALFSVLKRAFPVVVVDTASVFTDPEIAALEGADKILMVCTLELSTLRDVAECKRLFDQVIHIPNGRVYYVMNNPFPFKPLAMEQFVQNLEQSIDAEIPYGNDLPAKSSVGGHAFVQTQPNAPISKGITALAKVLEVEAFPQAQPEKRGLFGRR
jgi:pilus assembly protein CpaE